MFERLNQPYSSKNSDECLMDLFLPEGNANGRCILFIHGGGFAGGKRQQWNPVAQYFCERGYTCASMSYRLAPQWRFPSQIEDVRLAMSFLRENANKYHYSPDHIAAYGSSAGGYLALMLATISGEEPLGVTDELKVLDTMPSGVVCYCPASTLHYSKELWEGQEQVRGFISNLMGKTEAEDRALFSLASPYDRIKGNEKPFLFIHGDRDDTIPLSHSVQMRDKINALGGSAQLVCLEGVGHGFGYGITTQAQKNAIRHAELFLEKLFQGERAVK